MNTCNYDAIMTSNLYECLFTYCKNVFAKGIEDRDRELVDILDGYFVDLLQECESWIECEIDDYMAAENIGIDDATDRFELIMSKSDAVYQETLIKLRLVMLDLAVDFCDWVHTDERFEYLFERYYSNDADC